MNSIGYCQNDLAFFWHVTIYNVLISKKCCVLYFCCLDNSILPSHFRSSVPMFAVRGDCQTVPVAVACDWTCRMWLSHCPRLPDDCHTVPDDRHAVPDDRLTAPICRSSTSRTSSSRWPTRPAPASSHLSARLTTARHGYRGNTLRTRAATATRSSVARRRGSRMMTRSCARRSTRR